MDLIKRTIPLIILMTVLSTSLYIVARNLPPLIGSFRYFWGPLTLCLIVLMNRGVFKQKPMILLILYGIISLGVLQYTLWWHMNDWDREHLLNEFYGIVVFTAIFFHYHIKHDYIGFAKLSIWAFVFVIITAITTNIALHFDPLIVRTSFAASRFTPFQEMLFKRTGAGGFGYVQAFVCLMPIIIYHIKVRKKLVFPWKILVLVFLLLFVTLVRTQVFGNILVALLVITFSFIGTKNFNRSLFLILISFIIMITIPASVYSDLLIKISAFFDSGSNIHYKLNDFAFFIRHPEFGGDTGTGYRAERYILLFDALKAAPFFGDSSYKSPFIYNVTVGNHLYWMNKLTIWGIFGFMFFLIVIFNLYKKIRSVFDDQFGFYYFLSCLSLVLMGLMKNIAGREPFLMLIVIIPGLYFLPLLEKKKQARPPHQTNQFSTRRQNNNFLNMGKQPCKTKPSSSPAAPVPSATPSSAAF